MNNLKLGKLGENIAINYLIKIGYKIIGHNYWHKLGEIDIIARDNSGVLVFCEVKTMNIINRPREEYLIPEDNLSIGKLKKMRRVAQIFAQDYSEWIWSNKGWRLDLVTVTIMREQVVEIHHYRNL